MYRYILIAYMLLFSMHAHAGSDSSRMARHPRHTFYISWGYNAEWYTNSTLHVSQPGVGNDYTFHGVKAHDHRGWDEQSILSTAISIPQYNYRLGYMLN